MLLHELHWELLAQRPPRMVQLGENVSRGETTVVKTS